MKKKSTTANQLICLLLFLVMPVLGNTQEPAPGDLYFERASGDIEGSSAFSPSIFPHWIHRIHYRCDVCHDRLFKMELGSTVITMDKINNRELCGTCHNGEVAFSSGFENCNRCHVNTE